jgi:hypothetical protein
MSPSKVRAFLAHPGKFALALVGVGGLVLTAGGVSTVLNATASNQPAQSVAAGTLKMQLNTNGSGLGAVAIANMKPGDVVNRFIQLDNTGTLTGAGLSLKVAAGTANLLSTDATRGLTVGLASCSVAWTPGTGACSGTTTPVLADTPLSTLAAVTTTLLAGSLADPLELKVAITLPDQGECNVNNQAAAGFLADCTTVLTGGSIQSLSNTLTFNFQEAQQAAGTTNS